MPSAPDVSLHEAAERLGVHYMTVYRWVRTGRLPARRDGAQWRVATRDLERPRGRAAAAGAAGGRRPRGRAAAAARLRSRLVAGDEVGAWTVVEESLAGGADPVTVSLEVLAPALRAIGDGWADGSVSVADEHRASVVAARVQGRLGPHFARPGRKRGTLVVGSPAGERHALPGAMLADVMRGAGFDVVDLGVDTPPDSFVQAAHSAVNLLAVIVGATQPGNEPNLAAATRALGRAGLDAAVLLGGAAISGAQHARRLGADAWTGTDARAALAVVEGLRPTRS